MDKKKELPIIDRLIKAHVYGLNLIEKNKLNILSIVHCLVQVKNVIIDLFGESLSIVSTYKEYIKAAKSKSLTKDEFKSIMWDLSLFISHIERIGGGYNLYSVSSPSPPPLGNQVFIIHGHDELNTHRLKTMLSDNFKINPVTIMARPGMSKPLIEKYEGYASSSCFAIALVTPDDEITNHKAPYFQSRPNVIFEIGWFVGRLGKGRVLILLKEGTEIHSDLHGVSRVQFKENIEEKYLEISKELEADGLLK